MGAVTIAAGEARVEVHVQDPALAERLRASIAGAVEAALARDPPRPELAVVVAETGLEPGLAAAVVLVPARPGLARLVDAVEAGGAAGIQIVWDGAPRRLEREVFGVLEAWRGARRGCPLVLAPGQEVEPALWRAIARRGAGSPAPRGSISPG